jgi:hypothetical protein
VSKDTRLHLEVTLDLDADKINGTIDDGSGPTVEFTGYLELMSAFDTVTARANTSWVGEKAGKGRF